MLIENQWLLKPVSPILDQHCYPGSLICSVDSSIVARPVESNDGFSNFESFILTNFKHLDVNIDNIIT